MKPAHRRFKFKGCFDGTYVWESGHLPNDSRVEQVSIARDKFWAKPSPYHVGDEVLVTNVLVDGWGGTHFPGTVTSVSGNIVTVNSGSVEHPLLNTFIDGERTWASGYSDGHGGYHMNHAGIQPMNSVAGAKYKRELQKRKVEQMASHWPATAEEAEAHLGKLIHELDMLVSFFYSAEGK